MRRVVVPLLLVLLAGCGAASTEDPEAAGSASPDALVAGCPAEYGGAESWVPAPPTTETEGRLVPDADPVEALVCRYAPEGALEGEVLLEDGLNRIRHDLLLPEKLEGQQRACTRIGGSRVPHLMRLVFADGELWVSAVQEPNSCTDSSNGDFVTDVYLGDQLAASYDAAAWQPPPEPEGCVAPRGRLGQERTLVPEGWESLTVCSPTEPRVVHAGTADAVADLLRDVRTAPGSGGCSGTPGRSYQLLFRWAEGPPVQVSYLAGCEPAIRNGSLDGMPTPEQASRLEDLLAQS